MAYEVLIKRSAEKELDDLPPKIHSRIIKKLVSQLINDLQLGKIVFVVSRVEGKYSVTVGQGKPSYKKIRQDPLPV